MIVSSRAMKILAVALAAGLHGAFAVALIPETEVEMEGASGSAEVRLGSSFADMAAGTLASQEASQQAEPAEPPETAELAETPARTEATRPESLSEPPRQMAEAARPEMTRAASVTDRAEAVEPPAEVAQASPVPPAVTTTVDGAAPVARTEIAALPQVSQAAGPPEALRAPTAPRLPAEASRPAEPARAPSAERLVAAAAPPRPAPAMPSPQRAEPAQAPERLEPEEDDTVPLASSPRPQARPQQTDSPPEPPRRADAQREAERQATAAPQGNAESDARAGQATGREEARAVSRGAGGNSRETGNAAASNYPGEIMRKLSRVRRPSVDARGATVVAFRVADNGRLAGASIARSSDSTRLDRAALQVVQRAAPFPPPPRGAQRSFTIEIAGR